MSYGQRDIASPADDAKQGWPCSPESGGETGQEIGGITDGATGSAAA
jgi:hypothetical protein